MEEEVRNLKVDSTKDIKGFRYSVTYRVVLVYVAIFLGYLGYFPVLGLLTSFNADLGYVTGGVLRLCGSLTQVVAPIAVSIINLKYCLIIHFFIFAFFYATNFYPSWYTIPLGAGAFGFSAGLFFWTAALTYLTEAAQELSEQKKRPLTHYVSMFHGGMYGVYHFAGFAGNAMSAAFFLSDQLLIDNAALNSSNLTNSSFDEVCMRDTLYTSVSSWAYYGFFGISTLCAIISVVTLFCLPTKGPKHCVCKSALRSIKPLLVNTFKAFFIRKFMLMLPLSFYYGLDRGFFFASFTKYFVAECLGVGLVGPVVMVWAISSSFSSFITGRTSVYTSRTLVALISSSTQAGLMVFMLLWEREPSYIMVFIVTIMWGYIDGIWQTIPSTYVGVVADEESRKLGFSNLKLTYCIGGILSFFLAGVMPVYVNLIVLAAILPVSIILYIVGELVYAKDRARIFPCCREVITEEKDCDTWSPNANEGECSNENNNYIYFETPL